MRMPESIPIQVPWKAFLSDDFDWRQGEHVSLIGPTGTGKTTLGLAILPRRRYVVVVATKPRDAALDRLIGHGYRALARWPEHIDTEAGARILLKPRMRGPADVANQRKVIGDALQAMFRAGGWTIFIDELRYVSGNLRLRPILELIWLQGRSLNLSLVGGTQRPAHVPLEMYDQATHLFFWRDNDRRNLERISGLGGIDADEVRDQVANLDRHATLYVNTRTGDLIVTRVELPAG